MSKFEHQMFSDSYGDNVFYCVNKEKYPEIQAREIAEYELEAKVKLLPFEWYVRHRAGVDEDSEPRVGWWLEMIHHPRSCPVWTFER